MGAHTRMPAHTHTHTHTHHAVQLAQALMQLYDIGLEGVRLPGPCLQPMSSAAGHTSAHTTCERLVNVKRSGARERSHHM